MTILFQNQTANATSTIFPPTGNHNGGPVWLSIAGTFDGGTVVIEVEQDGIGFVALQGVNQTVADVNEIFLANGHRLRLVLSGVGASTDITASASPRS